MLTAMGWHTRRFAPIVGLWAFSAPAFGAPFNAYGYRMDPATVALNPYAGAGSGDPAWASLYVFWGVTPWLDVGGAANGALTTEGQPSFDSWEFIPRFFPSTELEFALVGHVIGGPDSLSLGPELHLAGYPTSTLGVWVNAGARYPLRGEGVGDGPETFAWLAAEVTDDVPFLAFEVDLESSAAGDVSITLVPSVGVWVGQKRETGISAGWIIPVEGADLGFGLWLWRTIDLRGEGRQRRNRPRLDDSEAG